MTTLVISKDNFMLIKNGKKKREWRNMSKYNRRLLLTKRADGKYEGNNSIKQIRFVLGYKKPAEEMVVECISVRVVKFINDIKIPEDNFRALSGQFAIEISLGEVK